MKEDPQLAKEDIFDEAPKFSITKSTFINPQKMDNKFNEVRTGKEFRVRKITDINHDNVLAIEL